MRLENWQSAEASFSRAADLAPGIAGYRLRHAQLAFQNGHVREATALMKGVARKYPSYAGMHVWCARRGGLWHRSRRSLSLNCR